MLMYFGYFSEYNPGRFWLLGAGCLLGAVPYIVYYGLLAPPIVSIYTWWSFFLLFPKKGPPPEADSLFSIGFGIVPSAGSMYSLLEVVCLVTVAVAAARAQFSRLRLIRSRPEMRVVWAVLCAVCMLGIAHLMAEGFRAPDARSNDHVSMMLALWPIAAAMLVVPALKFVTDAKQVAILFRLVVVSGLFVVLEAALALIGWLPEPIVYYSLNYRGAFRSFLQSGDLFVGQLLILGVASAAYFAITTHKAGYVLAVGLFVALVFATYDRACVAGVLVTTVVIAACANRRTRAAVGVLTLFAALLLAVDRFALDGSLTGVLDDALNVPSMGKSSYFDASSSIARIGTSARGLDVFLSSPFMGAGPGNVSIAMGDPSLRGPLSETNLPEIARDVYWEIMTGVHQTDPHNLFVSMAAEYGFMGILLAVTIIAVVTRNTLRLMALGNAGNRPQIAGRIASLVAMAALGGYGTYFMFQAQPPIFAVCCVLLHIATGTAPTPQAASGSAALRP